MPYITIVAGTVITAAWGNANVRDQVITPYASEAARDSGAGSIAAPVDGMISTVIGNAHGLAITGYNASAPGGAAWQMATDRTVHVALRTSGDIKTGATNAVNAYTTAAITIKGSTAYRIMADVKLSSGAAANAKFLMNIVRVSTGLAIWTGPQLEQQAVGDGVSFTPDFVWVSGAADTSIQFIIVVNCAGGVAYDIEADSARPFYFEVRECPFLPGAIVEPPAV